MTALISVLVWIITLVACMYLFYMWHDTNDPNYGIILVLIAVVLKGK